VRKKKLPGPAGNYDVASTRWESCASPKGKKTISGARGARLYREKPALRRSRRSWGKGTCNEASISVPLGTKELQLNNKRVREEGGCARVPLAYSGKDIAVPAAGKWEDGLV